MTDASLTAQWIDLLHCDDPRDVVHQTVASLAHTPDSDRAKRPPLAEPSAPDQELNPGDRVEGLGNFGRPTGEIGTVEQANEDDALVKWDDDGRMRLRQPWLKKI
jgi:hypothetical protein